VAPTVIGLVIFVFVFGGALTGMYLRNALPDHHFSDESKESIKLGTGLIATMTALVLGLMTASAKSSFDAQNTLAQNAAADVLTMDRDLARFGPETKEIRDLIRRIALIRINDLWPADGSKPVRLDPSIMALEVEAIGDRIRALSPHDEAQWRLQRRALDIHEGLLKSRWLMFGGSRGTILPPFLIALVCWLTITFMSFGLFAPRNAVVIAVMFLCALSVSSVVFLILEMDDPFQGLIRVSDAPLRYALSHLGQ
jgi:hypothetical protein